MSDPSYPSYPSYPGPPPQAGGPFQPAYAAPLLPRPARGLAIAAACLAGLIALIEVIEIPLAWMAQGDYIDAADRGESGLDVWTAYDLAPLPYFAAAIAAYVVTCLWLNQVRTNVEILRPWAHQSRSKGWIWGGWLVPVVSLWFPFQIVRDVSPDRRPGARSSSLLGWWWALWLIGLMSGQIGAQLIPVDEIDKGAIGALGTVETINGIIMVGALVLWLRVIRSINRDQDEAMAISV